MTALRTFLTSDAPDHVVIPVLALFGYGLLKFVGAM
jgi:hypothetical protein